MSLFNSFMFNLSFVNLNLFQTFLGTSIITSVECKFNLSSFILIQIPRKLLHTDSDWIQAALW